MRKVWLFSASLVALVLLGIFGKPEVAPYIVGLYIGYCGGNVGSKIANNKRSSE